MDLRSDDMTKVVYVAISEAGFALGAKLAETLGGEVHGLESRCKGAPARFANVSDHLAELFLSGRPIVAICATGIVVRALAAHLSDKWHDSPVVALSEDGGFVVPVIGGHHGAITLSRQIASQTGGQAAITTASESVHGVALDMPPKGYRLANREAAKDVMAALVNGAGADISATGPLSDWLADLPKGNDVRLSVKEHVCVPADNELVYYAQDLMVGAGCARGCAPEELADLLSHTLASEGLAAEMVAAVGSLSLKADEPAMSALAQSLDVPLRVFSAQELQQFEKRVSDPSDVVKAEVGTSSVSEASALALAGDEAELLVTKHKSANATIAIARRTDTRAPLAGRKPGKLSLKSGWTSKLWD